MRLKSSALQDCVGNVLGDEAKQQLAMWDDVLNLKAGASSDSDTQAKAEIWQYIKNHMG